MHPRRNVWNFVVMNYINIVLNLLLASVSGSGHSCNNSECKVVSITANGIPGTIKCVPEARRKLCILCYPGQNKTWYNMWINPKVSINLSEPEQYLEVYFGKNWSAVLESSKNVGFLSWPSFSFIKHEYGFEPFEPSCIGFLTDKNITADFILKNPDIWYLIYLGVGLCFFFFASSWSRNIFFHYSTGISIGVLCSVLIIMFTVNKFLPQKLKIFGYTIVGISVSTSLYLMRHISVYLNDTMKNYWQVLVGYLIVAGLLSFAVVYRYGPASDGRTLNLIQWTLQGIGLAFIYNGTQISEISIAIIVGTVTLYLLPSGLFLWVKKIKYCYFPPKTKLLTEEEYITEGEIETKKALKELREYCRSPNCDAWKTISRLKSPNRFAQFIAGDAHLSQEEYEQHEEIAELNLLVSDQDSSNSEYSDSELLSPPRHR